jgi:hypothetical protein
VVQVSANEFVGAPRRLATGAVVINANVTHEMNFGLIAAASRELATTYGVAPIDRSAGTSIEDMTNLRPSARPMIRVGVKTTLPTAEPTS